jgi:DNA polymerase III epsilon subunit-like protein
MVTLTPKMLPKMDSSSRQLHGALLDAELLAEVYLAMTHSQASN